VNKGKNSYLPISEICVGDCERRRSDFLDEGERRLGSEDVPSNANSGIDRRFDVRRRREYRRASSNPERKDATDRTGTEQMGEEK